LLKNSGFGEGLSAMSLFSSSSCKPYFPQRLPPHLPVLPGYLFFFFYLFLLPLLFLFFFLSLFLFLFFFFLFPFSFFFLFFYFFILLFYLLSFLSSFNIFGRPFTGREERNNKRKGIINSYQHFY